MKKETVELLLERLLEKHAENSEKEGSSHSGFFHQGAHDATKWALELVKSIDEADD